MDATVVCWFVTYCNLPKISLWRLRRFTKSQSHLQQIPPTSFILSQLCVHGAFKIIKQLVTELFFHSLCIRSSLHSTPCRPHRPFPRPLASVAHSIHGGARGEEPLHDGGVAAQSRPVQRCPNLRRRRAPETSTAGSTPWLSTAHPHCSGRNCNLWSEVREFHLF